MPDIANYAYLWYRTENPFDYLSPDEYYTILDIVTTYSYPCYLSGGPKIERLSPPQKQYLLTDEIGFIRARMEEHGIKPKNITIIQIPRVLYDLFLLVYYTQTQKMRKDILINCGSQPGVATFSDLFGNFERYKTRIARYLEVHTKDILEQNNFIIRKIYYIARGKNPRELYGDTPKKPPKKSAKKSPKKFGFGSPAFHEDFTPKHKGLTPLSNSDSESDSSPKKLGFGSFALDEDMSPATFSAYKKTKEFLAKKKKIEEGTFNGSLR